MKTLTQGIEKNVAVWEHKLKCKSFCEIQRLRGLLQSHEGVGSRGQACVGGYRGRPPLEAPRF